MNTLLIGSGGREHALALALSKSKSMDKLYCTPGNPGIFQVAEKAEIDLKFDTDIIEFCKSQNVELVVVGPEQPLADGLGNTLREAGIAVFGPDKAAARLEASKGFAKEFMDRQGIPTAAYKTFTTKEAEQAHEYIQLAKHPLVLKADGLAAGKGVIITNSVEESIGALNEMFEGLFGDSGRTVVIEEFLRGEEASVLAVTDGRGFITLAPSQDHKRALDGDKGKNTGGMGAYAPAPIVTHEVLTKVHNKIISRAIKGCAEEGMPFVGCLYAGLMINNGEPSVVEFNVRFGDPETQAVLPLVEGDFAGLLFSAAKGKLDKTTVKNVYAGNACCVVMASDGYPGSYEKGFEITGLKEAQQDGSIVYHAGTKEEKGKILSSGGRVLGVTGLGQSLKDAIEASYKAVGKINFKNSFYRKDIGHRAQ